MTRREISMNRSWTTLATLIFLSAATVFSNAAYADDINFTFNHSCTIDTCPDGTPRNLTIPNMVGNPATDDTTISFANSLPITTGNLTFHTAGATSVYIEPDEYTAYFNAPGSPSTSSFTISGQVPGTGPGATLLSGYFLPGGVGTGFIYGSNYFDSPVYVTYANPALLNDLGMSGATPYGDGELHDSFSDNGPPDKYWQWSVSLDFTPSPEPSSLVLFGSGILGLAGLLRRRFLG
jgi:PEP-CTERM motif